MKMREFIHRQRSRWEYRLAKNGIEKKIAEINRDKTLIEVRTNGYFVRPASVEIPKGTVAHVFIRFDLFIQNMTRLNGTYVLEGLNLYFLFDTVKIQIFSSNELFIINEIFVNRCYNFKLPQGKPYNVIDIGMNVGLASLFFAQKEYVYEVFSFEPFPQAFDQANSNFKSNHELARKIKTFNFGLGKGERIQELFFDPLASGTSGVTLNNRQHSAHLQQQPVLIKDAFEVISRITANSKRIPFVLKIDCEGCEYEIMESLMEVAFPGRIVAILMEWHGKMPPDFEAKIQEIGFHLVSTRLKDDTGLIYAIRDAGTKND